MFLRASVSREVDIRQGGIVGGWVFGMLGIWPGGGILGSIIVAFIGAVILVWISRLLKKA
jgi:uncharacterized membrane protein YeaQ/YmgE (transglycosylase-associated protein family)